MITHDIITQTPSTDGVLCYCVTYIREHHIPSMPFGDADTLSPNSPPFEGAVAIFYFPPSGRYPNGTQHVAYIEKIESNRFYIQQANKQTCKHTTEWVSWDDPNLVGFYNPNLDTLSTVGDKLAIDYSK